MFQSFTHVTQTSAIPVDAVALIPMAAVEAHGPHLPLGTDCIIAEGIIDHAASSDRSAHAIYRLPTLWLGASDEHAGNRGTLSLDSEQVIAQVIAIGEGLARRGIQRVVLFNAHGGNVALASIAALKLRTRFNMLAASIHWLDFGLPPGLVAPAPIIEDVHGGWIETSILLHIAPHLVAKELPPAALPVTPAPGLFPRGNIQWGWKTSDLAPDGYIGRPDLATAALGRALTVHAAERLMQTLHDLARAPWAPRP